MKTIILDVAPPSVGREDLDIRMVELASLVSTYGGITIIEELQKRDMPDYRTYVGSGKLEELIAKGDELGAELLIIGNILKPAQIYQVNEMLRTQKSKMQAWDRVDLILKIFAQHANSPEAKLQIELASIKHMGPRIYGMGMELSRQGGGLGAKGQGETNTEIMKRHLRDQTQKIREKLEIYERTRAQHRKRRKRQGFTTVGIVGYTNAGKSTLMNVLTNKGVLAENKLFATLGTSVGKMYVPTEDGRGMEILVNDTIGFIRDLPPDLIAAFSSTLEDSIEADLLLHVIDAGDPDIIRKMAVVDETLQKIGANQPRLLVFNKTDTLTSEQLMSTRMTFALADPGFVSAHAGIGIDVLKQRIMKELIGISR